MSQYESEIDQAQESKLSWRFDASEVVKMVKAISGEINPEALVTAYTNSLRRIMPVDRVISLSQRHVEHPYYRVARISSLPENFDDSVDDIEIIFPEKIKEGGLVRQWFDAAEPVIIDEFTCPADDPIKEYLEGYNSLLAIPVFDGGVPLNLVVMLERNPYGFKHEELGETVWVTNLFARAVHHARMHAEMIQLNAKLDRENKVIADIQSDLLPEKLPEISTMELASYYEPADSAGGDYYDVIQLPYNRYGILIADVSGHGSSAAVLMAITHAILNTHPELAAHPAAMLEYLNEQLSDRYTKGVKFVTAFYGVYHPDERRLVYAVAGHNPPRLKRCSDGSLIELNRVGGLPLGIMLGETYEQTGITLQVGDQVVFYTDGITEARNPKEELFGEARLDAVLEECGISAQGLIVQVLHALKEFSRDAPQDDDQTLLVAKIL